MIHCEKEVAVLLATYNGEHYLSEQIESLLIQSYQEFNIYVHDDGSNDRTKTILNDYKMKYPSKIYIIEGEKTGAAKDNFFYLLNNVIAEYYMFCDQDDIWLDDKIQKSVHKIKSMENKNENRCLLACSDLRLVNEKTEIIVESYFRYMKKNLDNLQLSEILKTNIFVGCTLIINRELRENMIRYQDTRNIEMHDWWAGLLAVLLGRVGIIEEQTILYRQHSMNVTGPDSYSCIWSCQIHHILILI